MHDSDKGRKANQMGKFIARKVAEALNVNLDSNISNECNYMGSRGVIKSVRIGNNLFGITKKMHERLDVVILAVESSPNIFDVYSISMKNLIKECPTTGENSGKGKVVSYYVNNAISIGEKVQTIKIDLSAFD